MASAYINGLLIGLILGVILMLFVCAAGNKTKEEIAEKNGIIELGSKFYYITKIKEENKNEQN